MTNIKRCDKEMSITSLYISDIRLCDIGNEQSNTHRSKHHDTEEVMESPRE